VLEDDDDATELELAAELVVELVVVTEELTVLLGPALEDELEVLDVLELLGPLVDEELDALEALDAVLLAELPPLPASRTHSAF
jgi:hypothetical protein